MKLNVDQTETRILFSFEVESSYVEPRRVYLGIDDKANQLRFALSANTARELGKALLAVADDIDPPPAINIVGENHKEVFVPNKKYVPENG